MIASWVTMSWGEELSIEYRIVMRIKQFERCPKDIHLAILRLKAMRAKPKKDLTLDAPPCPGKFEEGDSMFVYDRDLVTNIVLC